MAGKKAPKKTTTIKTPKSKKPNYATLEPVKKEEEVKKEVTIEVTPAVAQLSRYEVDIMLKGRYSPTNLDVDAGTYSYSELRQELDIPFGKNGAYGADIENLILSAIVVEDAKTGTKINISPVYEPKAWIQNLHKSDLGQYYAKEPRVINEVE